MARILIIEDDHGFRKMLREMLEIAGYTVEEAPDGKIGMELYQKEENPADLIITDIFMPVKEGIEIIMELRHDDPDVKIIAISGGGKSGKLSYLKIAKDLGAQRCLVKPFTRKELLEAAKELLGAS